MKYRALTLALALTLSLAGLAHAQVKPDELTLVRDATVREQAGDFAGAQKILESILKENPQSLSALLSLERVLRVQGPVFMGDRVQTGPAGEADLLADVAAHRGHGPALAAAPHVGGGAGSGQRPHRVGEQ